ncbi:hypothetical protein P7K49_035500 [Saguinus oedipus]|uniref:Uncharacterized protein n=1 Tax=Saguinus oedipus TaxID=9490 RepID=A0ABQ9TMS1_SAGOE|nr:hypothetical protein P7K49_035500 [Saguinus oedipus]
MAWQTASSTQSGKVEKPHRCGEPPAISRPASLGTQSVRPLMGAETHHQAQGNSSPLCAYGHTGNWVLRGMKPRLNGRVKLIKQLGLPEALLPNASSAQLSTAPHKGSLFRSFSSKRRDPLTLPLASHFEKEIDGYVLDDAEASPSS